MIRQPYGDRSQPRLQVHDVTWVFTCWPQKVVIETNREEEEETYKENSNTTRPNRHHPQLSPAAKTAGLGRELRHLANLQHLVR